MEVSLIGGPQYLPRDETVRDSVSVIEAAYDLSGDDFEWLGRVLQAFEPILDRGLGIFGMFYGDDDLIDATLTVRKPIFVASPAGLAEGITKATTLADPSMVRESYYGARWYQSFSETIQSSAHGEYDELEAVRWMRENLGMADVLMARIADPASFGIGIGVPCPTISRFPPRKAGLVARLSRHVAAGHRLRRYLSNESTRSDHGVPDAVLTADGTRVLDARDEAKEPRNRLLLTSAARRILNARNHLRAESPERAVELWRALVNGRWSLIDSVDSDGKRFLLARRNDPAASEPAALAPEERVVLALHALGHSSKLVAYELGISPSTVSARLRRGLKKLGFRSVAELSTVFSSAGPDIPQPEDAGSLRHRGTARST